MTAQPVQLGFAVEFGPGDAALNAGDAGDRINVDTLHRGEVNHQSAINRRSPRYIVAPAANRDVHCERSCECDGVDDIGDASALGDQCWPFIDQPIVDFARTVIGDIRRGEKLARKVAGNLSDGLL